MINLVLYSIKLFTFFSLLLFSIGVELDSKKVEIINNPNKTVQNADFKLKNLGHSATPIILCHYFSNNKSELERIGEYVSGLKAQGGRTYWDFFENHVINECFGKNCLPYITNIYCNMVSTSSYDLGRLFSLSLVAVPSLGKNCFFYFPNEDLRVAQDAFRKQASIKSSCITVVKAVPIDLRSIKYISDVLGIPLLLLKKFFSIMPDGTNKSG